MSCAIPDKPGRWKHEPTEEVVDVYSLEPAGNILCLWGPDVGITYTGLGAKQQIWDTDEFQGHVPVHLYGNGPWSFVHEEHAEGI